MDPMLPLIFHSAERTAIYNQLRHDHALSHSNSFRFHAELHKFYSRLARVLVFGMISLARLLSGADHTDTEAGEFQKLGWRKTVHRIPMRDGVHLHTVILSPLGSNTALPILLKRTPYNASITATNFSGQLTNHLKELVSDGYIFAYQDIRGKFDSEGKFSMMRPPRTEGEVTDETTDAYDTIDWFTRNVPNHNQRVGIFGTSYLGWTTLMATLDPHPALKVACEEASPVDMFLGDDFHHNGAFRLSYAYEYAFELESARTNVTIQLDHADAYEAYLRIGSLANISKKWLRGQIPTWNDFVTHPNYDAFWQRQAVSNYLTRVTVPILHVAGWWDQEDFYGPLTAYSALEKHDHQHRNYFVAGPWNHGGWNSGEGRKLGAIDFGSSTGLTFRKKIRARWLATHLHTQYQPQVKFPEAITFQTGANVWEQHPAWPPRDVERRALYFHHNGRLSFDKPLNDSTRHSDAFVSDPSKPVPYRTRPIETTYGKGSRWRTWLVEDQRHAHSRPDVLSYETDPLTEDLVVTGEVFSQLFASISGSDADWVVKLIDVYPQSVSEDTGMGGYQLMVASEVFRGRYRNSFEHPSPIKPGKIESFRFSLRYLNHRFQKGHKIMVQVQSTWFPLIDRNPQRYVPNIFEARDADFRSSEHRVFRTKNFGSHIDLPVRKKNSGTNSNVGNVSSIWNVAE